LTLAYAGINISTIDHEIHLGTGISVIDSVPLDSSCRGDRAGKALLFVGFGEGFVEVFEL